MQNLSESVTDNITVEAVTDGEPSQEQVEVGSDHSDTGWETDLEIEGSGISVCECVCVCARARACVYLCMCTHAHLFISRHQYELLNILL